MSSACPDTRNIVRPLPPTHIHSRQCASCGNSTQYTARISATLARCSCWWGREQGDRLSIRCSGQRATVVVPPTKPASEAHLSPHVYQARSPQKDTYPAILKHLTERPLLHLFAVSSQNRRRQCTEMGALFPLSLCSLREHLSINALLPPVFSGDPARVHCS